MTKPARVLAAIVVALPVVMSAQSPQTAPPAPQAPPVFRTGTVLVPVDVRVIDRNGKPVTDLRQDEFVLLEDNVRQTISHFAPQPIVAAAAPEPGGAQAMLRSASVSDTVGAQTRRTFLIVLGRGRLQSPGQNLDAMVHLVRERLLPQDFVAVMAWNKATDFTTDHDKVAAVLERYAKQYERVEQEMALYFSGLAARYGGPQIPDAIQKKIDQIFTGAGLPGVRSLPDAQTGDAGRRAADQRTVADALQRSEQIEDRTNILPDIADPAANVGMSFDEYVSVSAASNQDLTKLYAGVSYLRYVDGEKHLLFVTERGLFLPRAEDDRSLAATAADARVVIDILHTGGMVAPSLGLDRPGGGRGGAPSGGPDWRVSTSRTVSQLTGGEFSTVDSGKKFVDKLDANTLFSYVLGYYPANANWNGQYRRINVLVKRPGLSATVEFRHGYFAVQQRTPLDRARVLTYTRVVSAANTPQAISDVAITATASNITGDDGTPAVQVSVQVRPERLSFVEKAGKKTGAIDIAVFCADVHERLLGESWNTVTIEMTPAAFDNVQKDGVRLNAKVSVKAAPRYVKIVIYDSAADVLGSALVTLDPPKKKK